MSAERMISQLRLQYPVEDYVGRALDRKLRLRGTGGYSALPLTQVAARLQQFLGRRMRQPFRLSELQPLTGGTSKEQFSFLLETQDATGWHGERLVLRTQAMHSPAETHRLREFQLLQAMQGVVPVPKALWIDPEGDEFQNPSLICSFVSGSSTAGSGQTDFRLSYGPYRERLAPQFVDMLARIHRAPLRAAELSAFEIPAAGSNEGVIKSVNWWARVFAEDAVEAEPVATIAEQWLRDHAPAIEQPSIVHGDYRSSNFLFSREDGQITAVLDWELAWIGDRHFDLAYAMQPLAVEKAPDGTELICGLMSRREFLSQYEQKSGLPVDPVRLAYYEVFVHWRNMGTTNAAAARCVREHNTHQDATLAWFVPLVGQIHLINLRRALSRLLANVSTE
jgi:aminoglycoside phosphotransferase (APT) family kinase protein